MIRSFRNRPTQRFFGGKRVAAFQGFADQATRRLTLLDNAESLRDLAALPSNRLESLRGDRTGEFSIRINRQWRVCFRWDDEGPYDVEIVDYY
ncbi:MAG: plasmid maintenance system killer protein [Holophagales bacterium]|nr:plasmid maintenance system killer protein [Holophagales bacterium]MYG31325.1 plasmid maintenance system killer protein [Holophagales bacterium]MYI78919.1 plasmid maintenance system killer protein [Holophagales bacterium]